MTTEELLTKIKALKTFTFRKFDLEGKECVSKIGVDVKDLEDLLNQFKSSSTMQSEKVCSNSL